MVYLPTCTMKKITYTNVGKKSTIFPMDPVGWI